MKTEINFNEFSNWFREHRPNNFSSAGLSALFDYLELWEEETGEQIEFDPIALCVEYTEYENLAEFKENYTCDEYQEINNYQDIDYYTQVIPIDSESFIILDF